MNIILWILQVLLAFWNITGAIFMAQNYTDLAQDWAGTSLPQPFWIALSAIQIIFSLGLIIPGIFRRGPKATPVSAIGLIVISLLGIVIYEGYTGFPGVLWGLIPAVLYCFVAYGRLVLKPMTQKKD